MKEMVERKNKNYKAYKNQYNVIACVRSGRNYFEANYWKAVSEDRLALLFRAKWFGGIHLIFLYLREAYVSKVEWKIKACPTMHPLSTMPVLKIPLLCFQAIQFFPFKNTAQWASTLRSYHCLNSFSYSDFLT